MLAQKTKKKKKAAVAKKHNEHYTEGDIELIYRVAKSPSNAKVLAKLLGRSTSAIDWIWRWCDGGNFPDESYNMLYHQVSLVARKLGPAARGQIRSLSL